MFEVKIKSPSVYELSWVQTYKIVDPREPGSVRQVRHFIDEQEAKEFYLVQRSKPDCSDFTLILKTWISL